MRPDCIHCGGWLDAKGYGRKRHDGRSRRAHRVAYCEHNGVTLDSIKGQVVRHTCDYPPCINGAHLVLGTQRENVADMHERGRTNKPKGERHHAAKLTDDAVRAIRARFKPLCHVNGHRALAAEFGVARCTISQIVNGKRWAQHLEVAA